MLHIYLKYASYWLHIWSKYGYEGDLTTLFYCDNWIVHCELINLYILDSWRLLWEALLKLATGIEYSSDEAHAQWMVI